MKKILLLSVLFTFLFAYTAQAQMSVGLTANSAEAMAEYLDTDFSSTNYASFDEMNVGLKPASLVDLIIAIEIGLNLAGFSGDDLDDFDGRTGFHIGAMIALMFTDFIGLQLGAYYSLQGGEFSDSSFSSELNFDYLNFQALARLHLLAGLYALAGLQFGFVLAAEAVQSFSGSPDQETDIKDSISSTDFGGVVGVLYQIAFLHFYAKYIFGLSEWDDGDGAIDAKHTNFQLGAAWVIKGKK